MTLQSSGAISLGNVNTELGRSNTATISLGETAVRTLAGVSSGAIALSSLYGKSNVSFSPAGGSAGSPQALDDFAIFPTAASVTISCTQSATWTWTRTGDTQGGATIASGGSGTSNTFSLNPSNTVARETIYTVSATAGGLTRYWTITLNTETNQ